MRADKYSALAQLFRSGRHDIEWCLRTLAGPCDGGLAPCSRQSTEALAAAREAFGWLASDRNGTLHEELERLSSPPSLSGEPSVPMYAAAYFDVEPARVERGVSEAYEILSFRWGRAAGMTPSHLSNELGFMAHCHGLRSAGVREAGVAARAFVADHMLEWATLCAAALGRSAEHPVYRYAALAMEDLLACESRDCAAGLEAMTPA